MDPFIKSFFYIFLTVYSFFTGVKRRARFLAVQKEMYPTKQVVELVKAPETRWSSRPLQMDRFSVPIRLHPKYVGPVRG